MLTDLPTIQQLAAERRDEFEVMMYRLQYDDDVDDATLDSAIDALVAPIVAAIDCTQCGNCCRALDVYITPDDAARLAAGLTIPLEAVSTRYLDHEAAAAVEEWGKFRTQPCAFLRGTLCSVYAHRPQSCRDYPAFTPDFRWLLPDMLDGAAICPIIYNVLDAVSARVEAGVMLPRPGGSGA
jgi:uncharacterized protein